MKTKFLLGTTILLGTSLLPLSVISCSNQVTSSEGDIKPSNSGQDNTNPIPPTDNNPLPPTDNEGENKPSIPGEDNTNPKPPTDNEGENKPSIPGEGNTNPTPPTDNGGQQPSQPTIVYHEITGYDDIDAFIKNDKEVISNLISQVNETFRSLELSKWAVEPKIIYGNMRVNNKIKEDGYMYIDISGVTFSPTTPAKLKYRYIDNQGVQKEAWISAEGKTVNIKLHFKSKTDFIGGGIL